MNVMVLGAGGAIGDAAANCLRADGHTVFGVSRRGGARDGSGPRWLLGDRADAAGIRDLVHQTGTDILIDFVGYEEAETQALLAALEGQVARYVLMSSGDVYRNYALLHRKETGAPDLEPLGEDAPLRTTRYPHRAEQARAPDDTDKWMDTYDKIPVEAAVRSMRDTEWVICRLPMVYGPGDRQRRFDWARAPLLARAPDISLPGAWLDWVTSYGFVDNVGAGIVLSAMHPMAAGMVLNITDEPPVANAVWLERLAQMAGWSGEIVRDDDPEHPLAVMTRALDLTVPLGLSGTRLGALGFVPPVSLRHALKVVLDTDA